MLSISELESAKEKLRAFMDKFVSKSGASYADCRIEVDEGKAALAQNGNAKSAFEDSSASVGIRVYVSRNGFLAGGMAGTVLGEKQLSEIDKVLLRLSEVSLKRAKANALQKAKTRKMFARLGMGINPKAFAETEIHVDTVRPEFDRNPLDCDLNELVKRCGRASKGVAKTRGIASNFVSAGTGIERKVFASTEGSLIDQSKAFTQFFVFLTAKGKSMESYYSIAGANNGTEGFDGKNDKKRGIEDYSEFIAKGTVELSNAPVAKQSGEVKVVLDPAFNTLLSHEIMGHPCEADRALKKEAAWAGRSWWFRGLKDNLLGKKVGSEQLTLFSDPAMEG
ncbi:MAG: metallopeptidase TldD-related protein, partial [archaeon]